MPKRRPRIKRKVTYPLTVIAKKVKLKDDHLLVVDFEQNKYEVPFSRLIAVVNNREQKRVTFHVVRPYPLPDNLVKVDDLGNGLVKYKSGSDTWILKKEKK